MSGSMDAVGRVSQRIAEIQQRIDDLHPLRVLNSMTGASSFDDHLRAQMEAQKAAGSATIAPPDAASTQQWVPMINSVADEYGLDPHLLRAVMQAESGGAPQSVSPKGAQGLMQLMPGTAELLGVSDPFDPEQNLRGGAVYLGAMLRRFTDVRHALAAYNAGPGPVQEHGGIPPYRETQDYVDRVLSYAESFRSARGSGDGD